MSKKSWNYKPDGPKPVRKPQNDDWKRASEDEDEDE